jgi:hypothetical protein
MDWKVPALIMATVLVDGCVVSSASKGDNLWPLYALRFQKKGHFGNTDPEQRREDFIACGVPPHLTSGVYLVAMIGARPGETVQTTIKRQKNFESCMRSKGYVLLGEDECGLVRENRGICK